MPSCWRPTDDGLEVDVLVVPRASRTQIVGAHDDRLKIQLNAPPIEGAANVALIKLLAKRLGVPQSALSIVRGATSKRKTIRLSGIERAHALRQLGLAALAAALVSLGSAGCQPIVTDVDISIVRPEDASALGPTDNVSVTLLPDGFERTFSTDGADFELSVELDPDTIARQLSVYFARGTELLAYGTSAPFTFAGADGTAVFVAYPGRPTTFPLVVDQLDPGALAARARERGFVILEPDGTTSYFDERTLLTSPATPLSSTPAADDGAFVGDALGGVQRIAWDVEIRGFRFDVGDDSWIELPLQASAFGSRLDAAYLVDASAAALLLFGGGEATDMLEVDLLPTGGEPGVRSVPEVVLDGPRRGATAMFLTRVGTDAGETVIVVGGDESGLALAYDVRQARTIGDPSLAWLPWIGLECLQLDEGGVGDPLRVLCAGGLRGGAATADAALLTIPPAGAPESGTAELLSAALPSPMAQPWWFSDAGAAYAQGAGIWVRVDRETLSFESLPDLAPRSEGGSRVQLGSGATFMVGGQATNGGPVTRFLVFVPGL